MATSSTAVTATKGPKLKVLPFDPHGDRLDLGKRWEKWFERFERDLKYNGCDPSKTPEIAKMALLIYAGTEVEDLHDTLPEPGRPGLCIGLCSRSLKPNYSYISHQNSVTTSPSLNYSA